jgi:cell division septation protein DedD
MNATQEPMKEEKGLSAHQLILMFLVAVAVCAVFFAAGFLVGYNERAAKNSPATESVSASSSVIPPVVNAPPDQTKGQAREATVTEGNPIRESAEPLTVPPLASPRAAGKPARVGAQEKSQTAAPGERYTIQVAASGVEAETQKVITVLKAAGYPAFLLRPGAGGKGDQLYRVEVGPYPTREEAEKARDKLAQSGFKKPFIKH